MNKCNSKPNEKSAAPTLKRNLNVMRIKWAGRESPKKANAEIQPNFKGLLLLLGAQKQQHDKYSCTSRRDTENI